MAATLALSIDTGEISVNMDDAEVTIDDFYLEIDYSLGIEHLLQDEIEEMIIEALEAEITDSVAPMIQESLEQLDLSYETEALGANLAVAASISELLVEEDGIEMAFDVEISIDAEETTEHPFEGCFTRPRAPDDISRTGDFALYVSDDLMNRLLFTIWQAARLSDELSTLKGTLSPIFVGIVGVQIVPSELGGNPGRQQCHVVVVLPRIHAFAGVFHLIVVAAPAAIGQQRTDVLVPGRRILVGDLVGGTAVNRHSKDRVVASRHRGEYSDCCHESGDSHSLFKRLEVGQA
jgi:hypothetical protein